MATRPQARAGKPRVGSRSEIDLDAKLEASAELANLVRLERIAAGVDGVYPQVIAVQDVEDLKERSGGSFADDEALPGSRIEDIGRVVAVDVPVLGEKVPVPVRVAEPPAALGVAHVVESVEFLNHREWKSGGPLGRSTDLPVPGNIGRGIDLGHVPLVIIQVAGLKLRQSRIIAVVRQKAFGVSQAAAVGITAVELPLAAQPLDHLQLEPPVGLFVVVSQPEDPVEENVLNV